MDSPFEPVTIPTCHAVDLDDTGCVRSSVSIDEAEVTRDLASALDILANADGWSCFRPGSYRVLRVDGQVMMSECLSEQETCVEAIELARGHVLVGGLGLGMILPPMLAKDTVETVTVVEANPLVHRLVAPHYDHPKLSVILADVFTWEPDRRFDFAWFDIWPDKASKNRAEMAALARRYRRHMNRGGQIRHWYQDQLKLYSLLGRPDRRFAAFARRRGQAFVALVIRELRRTQATRAAKLWRIGVPMGAEHGVAEG